MITDKLISEVAAQVSKSYSDWLEFWLQTIVPPIVMRWASEGRNIPQISNYLARQNIRIVFHDSEPCRKMLYKGNRLVATFEHKFNSRTTTEL